MTNLHYSPVLGCLRDVVMTMEINAVCVAVLCVNPNSSHNNRVQKVRCCYASFFFLNQDLYPVRVQRGTEADVYDVLCLGM